ncbi:deoxyguanosinetriphosphate triphosphohydrolase [Ascidiimonas sp. W6]|uniref:deoxyguanosinetriphosphate triphosphohydrolase n=1 Tax=Ascidiimonas meishanensis TaxID=3128903 RepID=UPI0030EC58B8
MNWEQLLSLKRYGDKAKRIRKEQDETRLGFEVDYDRIIFSAAFRSLQDKTQVIPLSQTDFVHTRLTHSLEVSVVGRSIGRLAGRKILEKHPYLNKTFGYQFNDFGAIVAAAALAHDIGNPPFGHSGEKAIGAFFKNGNGKKFKEYFSPIEYQDLIDFEGNANGFKILTETREGVEGGLRLSYATLGTFIKYPKVSLPKKPTSHIADKKFGIFQSDANFFNEVAEELGLTPTGTHKNIAYARHPLAFLVEAADDICYTIIDFEDGINLGLIDESFALEYLIKLVKDRINSKKYAMLTTTEDRLSYLRAIAISTLIDEAVNIFIENEDAILANKFHTSLLEKSSFKAQINDIIKVSVEKIYHSREVVEKEINGYAIINKLLEVFCNAAIHTQQGIADNYDKLVMSLVPSKYQHKGNSVYLTILQICCFVASLTDGKVTRLYKKMIK